MRLVKVILLSLVLLVLGGPWALYGLGLLAVSGTPTPPPVMASRESQLALWQQARGVGAPEAMHISPYTYLPLSLDPGPYKPSLLVAWWVANDFYDNNRRFQGNVWRQLSCGALVVWLTRNWSAEQLLSKLIQSRPRSAA